MHLRPASAARLAADPRRRSRPVVNSWVSGWSLWDVFLLCILTLAMLKLSGWRAPPCAFAPSPSCPRSPAWTACSGSTSWPPSAFAGCCRRAALPAGPRRYSLGQPGPAGRLWIPFAIVHARKALYPQLDGPAGTTYGYANVNMLDYRRRELRIQVLRRDAVTRRSADQEKAAAAPPPEPLAAPVRRCGAGGEHGRMPNRPSAAREYQDGLRQGAIRPGEPAWGWSTAGSPGRARCRRRKAAPVADAALALAAGARPAGGLAGILLLLLVRRLGRPGARRRHPPARFRSPRLCIFPPGSGLRPRARVAACASCWRAGPPAGPNSLHRPFLAELERRLSAAPDCAPPASP